MDKGFALRNLDEAIEAIQGVIRELEKAEDVGEAISFDCHAGYLDAYWHLNKVWNARHVPQEAITGADQKQFSDWCRFPRPDDLVLLAEDYGAGPPDGSDAARPGEGDGGATG